MAMNVTKISQKIKKTKLVEYSKKILQKEKKHFIIITKKYFIKNVLFLYKQKYKINDNGPLSIQHQQLTLYSGTAFVNYHLCHLTVTLFILSCNLQSAVALNCPCLLSFAQYFLPLVTVLDRPHLTYQGLLIGYSMSHGHHTDIQRPIIIGMVTAYLSLFFFWKLVTGPRSLFCFFVFYTIDLS